MGGKIKVIIKECRNVPKSKIKPIKEEWMENWPWIDDSWTPKPRKIIWIVTYCPLRPSVDDDLEDPMMTKPIQSLFDWAEEIATTSQIFEYGLRLCPLKSGGKTGYEFVKPEKVEEYIEKHLLTSTLPEFHIRFIDTKKLKDWFLLDFVPHIEYTEENPWFNYSVDSVKFWGVSGDMDWLELADLITSLLKKFYENTLTQNDKNLINEKANRAKVVTLPELTFWEKVRKIGGFVGPTIKDLPSVISLVPKELGMDDLKNSDVNFPTQKENVDYTMIRDCETLLFLELKDLVDKYGNSKRCHNCGRPLPDKYTGLYCEHGTPGYIECRRERERRRKDKQRNKKLMDTPI